jgi:hypothetical protein
VVTRLLATFIASGDGASADAAKIRERKTAAITDKRLDMNHPTETPGTVAAIEQQLPGTMLSPSRALPSSPGSVTRTKGSGTLAARSGNQALPIRAGESHLVMVAAVLAYCNTSRYVNKLDRK